MHTSVWPSATLSATDFSKSRAWWYWSKYWTSTLTPTLTLPKLGFISPSKALIKVVLPAPLGPVIPILSPRITVAEKLLTTVCSPKESFKSLTSKTKLPLLWALLASMMTLPMRSRRLARISRRSFKSLTRPSLRARRALTPRRIQASSWAKILSNSALASSSLRNLSSRNSMYLLKEPGYE